MDQPDSLPKPDVLPKSVRTDPMTPIFEMNNIISIPRATLKVPGVQSNEDKFNSFGKRTKIAGLVRKTSYMNNQRDLNGVPKRNPSYNIKHTSGQNGFDNKAFDFRSERNIHKPVIKRDSAYS